MRRIWERYTYVVTHSEPDGQFIGKCLEFPHVYGNGHSMTDALEATAEMVASIVVSGTQPLPAPFGFKP